MELSSVLKQIDCERIYQHVLRLEGTKHPVDAPGKLDEAAGYIFSEFKQYGLAADEQKFEISGFTQPFRNVEAATNSDGSPEFLVVAHYDTVEDCPGADDNASGVAVMLEVARVLAQQDILNLRFVSFTLEELNPTYLSKSRQIAQDLGLKDAKNRYTNIHTHEVMKRLTGLQGGFWTMGQNASEALEAARKELEPQLREKEIEYVEQLEKMYEGITSTSWPGKTATVGSSFWVDEAVRNSKKVSGVLCFDTIGFTSDKEFSQTLPPGLKPEMFQTNKVEDPTIGNFLGAIGDINSGRLAQSFLAQSALAAVDLPCALLQVPLGFQQIAVGMGDLLRSDHAPFWRQGIPALFLSDTANFRYPFYHTPADTIDKLDFAFLAKTCKATAATAVNMNRR